LLLFCVYCLSGSLSFNNCNAPVGNLIYINGKDLSSIVNKESFSYSYSLVDNNDLRGYERDIGKEGAVDLRDYLCVLGTPSNYDEFSCDVGCFQSVVCYIYLYMYI
jgi:hypothetical protein